MHMPPQTSKSRASSLNYNFEVLIIGAGTGGLCLAQGLVTSGLKAVHRKMAPMAMRVTEMGDSKGCPVIGQTEVASPQGDNITSPETELTSRWCSTREPDGVGRDARRAQACDD